VSIWVCAAGVGVPLAWACSHFAYAARVCAWSCAGGFGWAGDTDRAANVDACGIPGLPELCA